MVHAVLELYLDQMMVHAIFELYHLTQLSFFRPHKVLFGSPLSFSVHTPAQRDAFYIIC